MRPTRCCGTTTTATMTSERVALAGVAGLALGRALPLWAFVLAVIVGAAPGTRLAVKIWLTDRLNDSQLAKVLRQRRRMRREKRNADD